jgi:hypothetical protein
VVDIQARDRALQEAAGGKQEHRLAADPHQADRRGSGALHGPALPLPRRRDQGAAVPQLSLGRAGQPRHRLHRPHQPGREEADGGLAEDEQANYRGTEYIGKLGVEQSFEQQLHGITGVEQVETSAGGRAVRKLASTPATPGNTVKLSIDIKLQKLVEDLFGDRRGALVAIDPEDRRDPGLRQQADLRPQPVRRRHRPGKLAAR